MRYIEGGCLSRGAAAGELSEHAALRALSGSEPLGARLTREGGYRRSFDVQWN